MSEWPDPLFAELIRWREPIKVSMPDKTGWACRICIARHGLKGTDVHRLFDTLEEAHAHIDTAHPE